MYCYNCGQFFHEYEIVTRKGELGEPLNCCPRCGVDDIGETETCNGCGKEFVEGDTSSGYCLDCLWNAIDYDLMLEYLKDEGLLADFMVTFVFGAGVLKDSSPEFDAHLEETFKRMVANEKLLSWGGNDWHYFLDQCREFCIPVRDKGFNHESRDFAEWYADHIEKARKEIKA